MTDVMLLSSHVIQSSSSKQSSMVAYESSGFCQLKKHKCSLWNMGTWA